MKIRNLIIFFGAVLLVSIFSNRLDVNAKGVILTTNSPMTAQTRTLLFPGSGSWYVCQGMNTKEITHNNLTGKNLQYSLDLTTNPVTTGTYGCNGDNNAARDQRLIAPADGTVSYRGTDLLNIQFDSGGCMQIGHLSSRVAAGKVKQGAWIGTVAPAGQTNGYYSHIHLTAWKDSCGGKVSGFDGDSNTQFYGAPSMPATSQAYAYRKTKITQVIPSSRPAAPGGQAASSPNSNSMRITWTDNSNNETGFKVYNGNTLVSTLGANSTSVTINNLAANTWYCFRVTATNNAGESDSSGWACNYTQKAFVPLSKPSAPYNASAAALSSTSMRLTWADASNNESGFRIYNGSSQIGSVGTDSTSVNITGLQPNTWYCFQVAAYNNAGESSRSGWACNWTSKAVVNPVNLAKGKYSYATSQENSLYPPARGNDGSYSTRWSSQISSTLGYQWYIVDMGSSQSINQIVVNWEAAYAASYFVSYSTDCKNFSGYNRSRSSAGTDTVDLGTVNARCVGILMKQRAPNMNNYSIYEVEVYRR